MTHSAPQPPRRILPLLALVVAAVLVLGLLYGLGIGPFAAQPTPSPTLEPAASGTPLAVATSSVTALPTQPTAQPSPAVSVASLAPPPPTPDVQIELLLSHVPQGLRQDCVGVSGTTPVLATATCTTGDGQITVSYLLYGDEPQMAAAYDGFVLVAQIERDSGDCAQPETWPAEGLYLFDDEPAGRLLCMVTDDRPTIYWTNDGLAILTIAVHGGGDHERLWEFWMGDDSGPN